MKRENTVIDNQYIVIKDLVHDVFFHHVFFHAVRLLNDWAELMIKDLPDCACIQITVFSDSCTPPTGGETENIRTAVSCPSSRNHRS